MNSDSNLKRLIRKKGRCYKKAKKSGMDEDRARYLDIAGCKTDHRVVLAFTDQYTDLGTLPKPFTLAFCEQRAPVLR